MADPRDRALQVLEIASKYAGSLGPFCAPAAILAKQEADFSEVLEVIDHIAERFFGGAFDLEAAAAERFGVTLADPRISDLTSLLVDHRQAHQLAAFALGLAWGRLDARGGASTSGGSR